LLPPEEELLVRVGDMGGGPANWGLKMLRASKQASEQGGTSGSALKPHKC
jgi:hypothetical protein